MGKLKEYKVVYKYDGYELEAGQNGWQPKEVADLILENKKNSSLYSDRELYLAEKEVDEVKERAERREHQGKKVWNKDWFIFDAMKIGDYVEENIVDDFINMLPPACMRSDCSQIGDPHSSRLDEITGKYRNTYETFKRVAERTWEYCGDCFIGENVKRGKEMQYC